jgi:hypothetical protein
VASSSRQIYPAGAFTLLWRNPIALANSAKSQSLHRHFLPNKLAAEYHSSKISGLACPAIY